MSFFLFEKNHNVFGSLVEKEPGTDFASGGSDVSVLVSCQGFTCSCNPFSLYLETLTETVSPFIILLLIHLS